MPKIVCYFQAVSGSDSLIYSYNVLDERIKSVLYDSTGLVKTTWYAGMYERTDSASTIKQYYYINSPDGPVALAIKTGTEAPVIYYLCKDHLGSITGIMNEAGDILEEYNYDPWGRRRNPSDWSYSNVQVPTYTSRGYTGHEHLDMFNLINMNGRIYDSEIARFLNPDPVIQDPYNLLNYNRYTYCLNNPLKYSDPSGYRYTYQDYQREKAAYERQNGSAQFFNNYIDRWSAYVHAMVRGGYSGSYGNFVVQYNAQYLAHLSAGNVGESTSMTFTWHTWIDHNEIVNGVVHVTSTRVNHSVTTQISFDAGSGMNPDGTGTALNNLNIGIGAAGTFAGASELYIDNLAGKRITYMKFSGTRGWASTPKVVSIAKNIGTSVIVVTSLINVGLGFTGYLTPGKTITNFGVNWGTWAIGGWAGLAIGVGYTVLDGTGMFDRPAYATPYSPPNIAIPDALRVSIPFQRPIIYP